MKSHLEAVWFTRECETCLRVPIRDGIWQLVNELEPQMVTVDLIFYFSLYFVCQLLRKPVFLIIFVTLVPKLFIRIVLK